MAEETLLFDESLLDTNDLKRIFEFTLRIANTSAQFPEQVLKQLADLFGFDKCDFWLADKQGHIFRPVSSIGDGFILDFLKNFHDVDYLNARNVGLDRALKSKTLAINEVMTYEEFYETEYGRFLNRYGLHYEVALYLEKGGHMIGALAFLHSKKEGEFSPRDIAIMRAIADPLASMLQINLAYDTVRKLKKTHQILSDQSLSGYIIFGESYKVLYYNSIAMTVCEQISGFERDNMTAVESFVKSYLGSNPLSWIMGLKKTLILSSFRQVEMTIMPVQTENSNYQRDGRQYVVIFNMDAASGRAGGGGGTPSLRNWEGWKVPVNSVSESWKSSTSSCADSPIRR
jgi:hypothetical protein